MDHQRLAVRFGPNLRFEILDSADVSHARRNLRVILEGERLPQNLLDHVDLVVTELGSNLIRHVSRGGELLACLRRGRPFELELLSLDRGGGGATTDKTALGAALQVPRPAGLGSGLRAVGRLAQDFDLHSPEGEGTLVVARFRHPDLPSPHRCCGIVRPMHGESKCGDAWGLLQEGPALTIMLVDGLGHGPAAQKAAEAALECLAREAGGDLPRLFRHLNEALRPTRGAALAVAHVESGHLSFAGVGNLSAWLIQKDKSKGLTSHPGIMGATLDTPRVLVQEMAWPLGARLVMQSDGISSWHRHDMELEDLLRRDPALLAARVYRDARRERDDAAVVVIA
jgi:anti-sigma regulatory factor (Ser/Thr protein kinase)